MNKYSDENLLKVIEEMHFGLIIHSIFPVRKCAFIVNEIDNFNDYESEKLYCKFDNGDRYMVKINER